MSSYDVGNKSDRDQLFKAIKKSRNQITSVFCRERTYMIREFVGSHYSLKGSRFYTYVNKMNQTARIYSMALAFNNPQCKINSFDTKLWPFCKKYEVNINKVIQNIDLKTTMQAGVLDAFFLMAIYKVRMADSGYVETEDNVWIQLGKPWVDRVSFDDVILDLSVKDIRAMRFIGDRYRVSYRKMQEREDFDQKVVDQVSPTSKYGYDTNSESASQIASGSSVDDDELEPMVWLEDVYLPETRQIVTFAADNESLAPLKVMDDDSGPMGPYETLSLGLVPDNIIPNSPAQNLKGLHDLMNRLYRKMSQQASTQKNVFAYAAGAEDDANRQKEAKNGEYIKMRDPKSVIAISTPGVDGNTNAFYLAASEIYNVQAGNERMLGGLGTESDTVGQDRMIQEHSAGMISYMKGAVNQCASNICRKIGALMWDDEALTIDSSMEVENTGYYVDSSWRPGERKGIKDFYNFSVEPSSMGYQPPEAKIQKVMNFLQAVGTVYPLVQAGILDLEALTKIVSEYQNIPELQKVFKTMQQLSSAEGNGGMPGDPNQASKAPVTSREVIRSRGSGASSGGGMAQVLGQMMQSRGGGQQAPMGAGR